MLIKNAADIKSSEITPKNVYLNRRNFIRAGALAASATMTGALYRAFTRTGEQAKSGDKIENVLASPAIPQLGPQLDEKRTSYEDITHYNNFYEFSTNKGAVAGLARNFVTRPWTVEVGGLVQNPRTFDLDDLLKLSPLEERVYRHRCVEGWS